MIDKSNYVIAIHSGFPTSPYILYSVTTSQVSTIASYTTEWSKVHEYTLPIEVVKRASTPTLFRSQPRCELKYRYGCHFVANTNDIASLNGTRYKTCGLTTATAQDLYASTCKEVSSSRNTNRPRDDEWAYLIGWCGQQNLPSEVPCAALHEHAWSHMNYPDLVGWRVLCYEDC